MDKDKIKKDFEEMEIWDLHDELITLAMGDMWDGMSSKGNTIRENIARKVWDEKMENLKQILSNDTSKGN